MDNAVELRHISKIYGGVKALDGVSLAFEKGEIHALLGENGAGKSTLVKLLCGIIQPTSGEILLEGQLIHIGNAKEASVLGISAVHQEPMQMESMSVAENIFISRYPKAFRFGGISTGKLYKKTHELMDEIDIHLDPEEKIQNLSIAKRQMVEILKAVSYHSKIIIFDEPTSSITVEETKVLYKIIRSLKEQGKTIIYISHRLDEIFELCDRVTILRDGKFIEAGKLEGYTRNLLVSRMVGRNMDNLFPKYTMEIGKEILCLEHITNKNVTNINLTLRCGEILGIGGLVGAGRTELARIIFGMDKYSGSIYLNGEKKIFRHPYDAIREGIHLIPEDRKEEGLIRIHDISFNIAVPTLQKYRKGGLYSERLEHEMADIMMERLRIKAPDNGTVVNNLSGGNQQKVVFAKWLVNTPKILILDEPTKGIDVGSKREIYQIISDLAKKGTAIIMISSELPELIAMSDRIAILNHGKISGILHRNEFTEEKIMEYAIKE